MNNLSTTIELYIPTVTPISGLTGAALRSVQAADMVGKAAWDGVRIKGDILASFLNETEVSALLIVNLMEARENFLKAAKTVTSEAKQVVARWQSNSPYNTCGYWGLNKGTYGGFNDVIQNSEASYFKELKNAGVPLPKYDKETVVQFWRDVGALGA